MTMIVPQQTVTTTQVLGMPGDFADMHSKTNSRVESGVNADSVNLPFGSFVKRGTADGDAKLPSSQADILFGIVTLANSFARASELASTGITPGTNFGVGAIGEWLVLPGTDITPASEVHVQVVAEGGHPAGTIRGTASAAKTLDLTGLAKWLTSATVASGNPAVLQINMTNIALATADS